MNEVLVLRQQWFRISSDLRRVRKAGTSMFASAEAVDELKRLETEMKDLRERVLVLLKDPVRAHNLRLARGTYDLELELVSSLNSLVSRS
jgi:hypothetical protein